MSRLKARRAGVRKNGKAAGVRTAGGLFVHSSALVLAVLILIVVLVLVILILVLIVVLVPVLVVVLIVAHDHKTSFPKTVQPYSFHGFRRLYMLSCE